MLGLHLWSHASGMGSFGVNLKASYYASQRQGMVRHTSMYLILLSWMGPKRKCLAWSCSGIPSAPAKSQVVCRQDSVSSSLLSG